MEATGHSDNQKFDEHVALQCKILEDAYRKVSHTNGCKQDCLKATELYIRRRCGEPFQNGDLVILHSPVVHQGGSKKLRLLLLLLLLLNFGYKGRQ